MTKTSPALGIPTGAAILCVSVAARPGRFGATVFNTAFRELGLDYFYKPLGLTTGFPALVAALRVLDIRGCGVSMPFKTEVLPLVDRVDPVASAVGAANTIVNRAGELTAYNTDVDGARALLAEIGAGPSDRMLLLGGGGAARAVAHAASSFGMPPGIIAVRTPPAAAWATALGMTVIPWEQRVAAGATLLVNATSVGMLPDAAALPYPIDGLGRFRAVADVIVSPLVTAMVDAARARGLAAAGGLAMALAQAERQFELYTDLPAPPILRSAALSFLSPAPVQGN